ncbi:MAG TPA: serine/threonine-protein kinase [Chondromyces sp.]|nr:serine/threonine-protein kinase [Chondromyces sp.]
MMMNTSKNLCKFPRGTIVKGKWQKQQYTIIKELGHGANGVVYLVAAKDGYAALKMSSNSLSITSEVNVLKSFTKVQGSALGPSLLDVDDWINQGSQTSFYVMEYIQGPDLLAFIKIKGGSWIGVLLLQLLENLEAIHREGWVFGDLKPENLLVTGPPYRLRCIDVGGTTRKGRAIKEFTEFFDRGYWNAGSRKAEPSYDLFSAAMIAVNLACQRRFDRKEDGLKQVLEVVDQRPELQSFRWVIKKALKGEYMSASSMRMELMDSLSTSRQDKQSSKKANKNVQSRQQLYKKKKANALETVLVVMMVLCFYVFYILFHLV